MPKDLAQEFVQLRLDKAKEEIAAVLEKHQLLLMAEMNYTQGGIFPIIKLVEKQQATQEQEPVEEVKSEEVMKD